MITLDDHTKELNDRNGDDRIKWQVDPLKLSIHVRRASTDTWNSVQVDDILCEGESDFELWLIPNSSFQQRCTHRVEYGVYCELNLPDCVTYVLPSSSNATSIEFLASKIINVCHRIRSDRKDNGEIAMVSPPGASLLSRRNHIVRDPSLVRSWRQYWRRYVTHRSVLSPSVVGCIAAETVSIERNGLPADQISYFFLFLLQISIYPPGIPLLVKGEIIHEHHWESLQSLHRCLLRQRHTADESMRCDPHYLEETIGLQSGRSVTGNTDPLLSTIAVLDPVHHLASCDTNLSIVSDKTIDK